MKLIYALSAQCLSFPTEVCVFKLMDILDTVCIYELFITPNLILAFVIHHFKLGTFLIGLLKWNNG